MSFKDIQYRNRRKKNINLELDAELKEEDVDNQWVATQDPNDSSKTYYWNKVTRKTTWDKPPGMV